MKHFRLKPSAPHSLMGKNELYSRNPKIVTYWTESISFLAPKIWSIAPEEIKNCKSLDSIKKTLRKWKPVCPCRLYKICWLYIIKCVELVFNYLKFLKFFLICHIMIINSMFCYTLGFLYC